LFYVVALFAIWFDGGFGIIGWWDIVSENNLALFL
jgi:hypothetical protein